MGARANKGVVFCPSSGFNNNLYLYRALNDISMIYIVYVRGCYTAATPGPLMELC